MARVHKILSFLLMMSLTGAGFSLCHENDIQVKKPQVKMLACHGKAQKAETPNQKDTAESDNTDLKLCCALHCYNPASGAFLITLNLPQYTLIYFSAGHTALESFITAPPSPPPKLLT